MFKVAYLISFKTIYPKINCGIVELTLISRHPVLGQATIVAVIKTPCLASINNLSFYRVVNILEMNRHKVVLVTKIKFLFPVGSPTCGRVPPHA